MKNNQLLLITAPPSCQLVVNIQYWHNPVPVGANDPRCVRSLSAAHGTTEHTTENDLVSGFALVASRLSPCRSTYS